MPDRPNKTRHIVPRCKSGVGHYVAATGHYYPCCWAANATTYSGSLFETYRDQLDLRVHSLDEVLASDALRLLVATWDDFESAPRACQSHCGVTTEKGGETIPWRPQTQRENIPLKKKR
jgi:hypothetical protein